MAHKRKGSTRKRRPPKGKRKPGRRRVVANKRLARSLGVRPTRKFNGRRFSLTDYEDADPHALEKMATYTHTAGFSYRIVHGPDGSRFYTGRRLKKKKGR